MKKFLFLFISFFAMISASAQITWNLKGGVGVATCFGDAEGSKSHFVGKIGGGIEKAFTPNWSIMPSLEVAWKGTKFNYSGYGASEKETVDILYLQIPVLAAYRINLSDNWNMTVKAGPYFAVGVWGNVSYDYNDDYGHSDSGNENIFDEDTNRFDVGLDLGIDFERRRFVFGVEYEVGAISIVKGVSLHNSAFYATIGYKF